MNSFLKKIRSQIGILFLVSLSSIIVVNILCDLDIIEYKENAHDHSQHTTLSNDHDGDHQRSHDNTKSDPQHHGNNTSSDDDTCCEDLTQSLFHNLVKQKTESFNLDFKPFALYPLFSAYRTEFILTENILTVHEVANPPPLSGMDIRIIIQSFRN